MTNFFIFHGVGGNPQENWFLWIKQELEKQGHSVYISNQSAGFTTFETLLTLIIGLFSTIIVLFLLFPTSMASTPPIFYVIFFIPTWLGTLLPRIIIPWLRPGQFI